MIEMIYKGEIYSDLNGVTYQRFNSTWPSRERIVEIPKNLLSRNLEKEGLYILSITKRRKKQNDTL